MKPLIPWVEEVQWYEGMLLGPQQMQQMEIRGRSMLNRNLIAFSPYFWGVVSLEIDPVLLVSGVYRILSLRAFLPDGTFISFDAGPTDLLEVDLNALKEGMIKGGAQRIHLALPIENANSSNLTGEFPRYKSIPGTNVCDLNTGENFVYVPRLVPNVQLIVGDHPHPRYVSFPLAEVVVRDEGFQQSSFLPPQTTILKISPLGKVLQTIILALRNKCAFLSENLQASSSGTLDPLVKAHYEGLMSILVPHIPVLENMLGVETTSPFGMYQEFLLLAGSMATIKQGLLAPTFVPYDHNDIYASFDQLVTFILEMVNLIQENYTVVPFDLAGNVFQLTIEPEWESASFVLGIKGTSTAGPDLLAKWVAQGIIASESQIKSVRDRRILGASRNVIESNQELSIAAPENGILVSVKNDPNFIKPNEKLCFLNLQDESLSMPSQIMLFVKKATQHPTSSSSSS